MSIYVGDEACITLEDGTRVYILADLSEGADDDLGKLVKEKGWYSPGELIHQAITRIVAPDGEESRPSLADIRRMKMEVVNRIAEEVMARWFPLQLQEYREMVAVGETPSNGTSSSTPTEASAEPPHQSGPPESS
jgi:hypothetical protein